MQTLHPFVRATYAILTLAEIKEATEAFDRGETNASETLEAILEAVATYRALNPTRREAA